MPNNLKDLVKNHFKFLYDNNFYISDWREENNTLILDVKETNHPAKCPCCGHESNKIHTRNKRKVQDLPYSEKTTYLNLYVNKYICSNPECSRKTFLEELDFVGRKRTRTYRLEVLVLSVSRLMSNEGASQVLNENHVKISNDAINRLYQKLEFKQIDDPIEIGIDDVAILKGQNYATVVYDKETREMIALFQGRGINETEEWLRNHPKIQRVARDRLSSYAKAFSEILPQCEQVADRFHLFQNLSEKIEEIFKKELPVAFFFKDENLLEEEPEKEYCVPPPSPDLKRKLDNLNYDNSPPRDENGNVIIYDDRLTVRNGTQENKSKQNRLKKQKLIRNIQEFWNSLEKKRYNQAAKKFGISPHAAKKYIHMTEEEILALDKPVKYCRRTAKPIYNWLNVIYKMVRDNYTPIEIYYYIRERADTSLTSKSLENAINRIIQNNFPERNLCLHLRKHYSPEFQVVHRRDLIAYITSRKCGIPNFEKYFTIIMDNFPTVRLYDEVYQLFYSTIMGDEVGKLYDFLDSISFINNLKGFCSGIKKDIAAVENAISQELNSGFVEGLNCKFKLVKRILYGRALLVNLEKKCILYFMKNKSNEKLMEIVKNTFGSSNF